MLKLSLVVTFLCFSKKDLLKTTTTKVRKLKESDRDQSGARDLKVLFRLLMTSDTNFYTIIVQLLIHNDNYNHKLYLKRNI